MANLTPKQQRFVEEYLVDLNATQAAIRAGYSAKTADVAGPRLLGNVRVAAAIAAGRAAPTERTAVSQDYVVTRLREYVERSMQAVPCLDRDGNHTGEYQYAGSVANRALELLGKHLGMFVERHEHTGADGGPIEVAELTDAELVDRARTHANRLALISRNGNGNGNGRH